MIFFTINFLPLFQWLLLPTILLFSMTVKGGTSQACAACKYQRRRCTPECPLAPFFPADQPKIFQNAHRLFGVANMMRILKHIRDDQKDDAMQSIKHESNIWEKCPSGGCIEVIKKLREDMQLYHAECLYVSNLIEMVRRDNSGFGLSPNCLQFKQLSINPNNDHNGLMQMQMQNLGSFDEGTGYEAETKPLWAQQQQQLLQQSNHHHHHQMFRVSEDEMASQQYDRLVSEALVADDRQSYTEGKEGCDNISSINESTAYKEAMQSTTVKAKTAVEWFTQLSLVPSDDQDH